MKSTRPSLPMTGGCPCGAIRYEITSFPLLLYTCNCTDCQRQTGSAFALNMPVRFSDFRILQAEPTRNAMRCSRLSRLALKWPVTWQEFFPEK